ncbi:MAG: hypothetical protein GW823_06475 [Bacteroidetes bacterium]|nr:hypothetical protein [Bacteroidota bacterium]
MNKNELIKGITIDDIYEFVDHGDIEKTPEGIALYFELMEKVRVLDLRVADFGTKNSVINHLVKAEGLTRHMAEKVYFDGMEYYYSSAALSKQAQRNVYATKMERLIAIAELAVKDVKDANMVTAMYEKVAKLRQLDKEEIEFIPEQWLKEQFVIYTTDPIKAGLEPINRIELAKQIDSYPELSEKEKAMLRREAMIDEIIIFPNEQENARKD